MNIRKVTRAAFAGGLLVLAAGAALAHGDSAHAPAREAAPLSGERHPFGRQGDPAKAARTVTIDMHDTMRFTPSRLTVRQGETVRFVIRNKGKMLHELVLGTKEQLEAHGELMKKHPEMEHDEPWMAHVSPGKRGEMAWQFTEPGEFHFACLIPGHSEAGMTGTITVAARPAARGPN